MACSIYGWSRSLDVLLGENSEAIVSPAFWWGLTRCKNAVLGLLRAFVLKVQHVSCLHVHSNTMMCQNSFLQELYKARNENRLA